MRRWHTWHGPQLEDSSLTIWRSYSIAACQQPLCRKCSSWRSSRHCSRGETSTLPYPRSYRPIFNSLMVSKLFERIVSWQLYSYLSAADLLPCLQSAYWTHHSTETAMLKVLTDILYSVDDGDLSVLALLDLSAAFDRPTVNSTILLTRLKVSFSISGAALDWFQSYLTSRVNWVCATRFIGSVDTKDCAVWRATGVCPAPVHLIHCQLDRPHRGIWPWPSPSSVCRRHADTGVCRHRSADKLQSTLLA